MSLSDVELANSILSYNNLIGQAISITEEDTVYTINYENSQGEFTSKFYKDTRCRVSEEVV